MRRMTKWYLALLALVMIGGLAAWFWVSMQESRPSNAQLVSGKPGAILPLEAIVYAKPETRKALEVYEESVVTCKTAAAGSDAADGTDVGIEVVPADKAAGGCAR